MGFRDYSPGLNRFLSRDMYTGALADLNLGLSPWTNNRYAFTGGNPITLIEHDGHEPRPWHDPDFDSDTFEYDTYWAAEKAAIDSAGSNNTSAGSDPSELEYADAEGAPKSTAASYSSIRCKPSHSSLVMAGMSWTSAEATAPNSKAAASTVAAFCSAKRGSASTFQGTRRRCRPTLGADRYMTLPRT
jgi:RHS repeat-associated protein